MSVGTLHHQSISLQEQPPEVVEMWIRELRDVSHNELKIKISQKTNNGEHFTPILRKIHSILQQLTIRQWHNEVQTENLRLDPAIEEKLQMALRHMGSETIPGLIIHMGTVSVHVEEMSKLLLDVLSYLMALDPSCPLSFPSMFASCLLYINCSLWPAAIETIISQLCYYALPLAILYPHELMGKLDSLSMSGTLMLVLDNRDCELKHHISIMSVLMKIKLNACTDLLSVIAYGTPTARTNALKLLLHYWPLQFLDNFSQSDPFANLEIPCPACERNQCNNSASFLCLEGSCTTQFGKLHSKDGNKKLFTLLCLQCDGVIHKTLSVSHKRIKLGQPLRDVKPNCELRRVCVGDQGSIKRAVVTCYGESCTAIQNGYPIRLCEDCHEAQHSELNDPLHIYQIGPQNPWTCQDTIAASALLEAVAKLLNTPPVQTLRKESQRRNSSYTMGPSSRISISINGCREGILMLHQYCLPMEQVKQTRQREWLEYLIALLLEWLRMFSDMIERMMKESTESTDEFKGSFLQYLSLGNKASENVCSNHRELYGLLTDHVIPWLKAVCESGNTLCITASLQPHLQGHVQVGEMWQYSRDDMTRYHRTLSIVALLVRNALLSQEAMDQIYNIVMPQWMDLLIELRTTPGEMDKLKDLFHVIFPPHLVHDIRIKRFEFIRATFFQRSSKAKQKALFWLQDLSRLSVAVPYTSHIFEGNFQNKKAFRRQAVAVETQEDEEMVMPLVRKESTGSMSGYESESGLVSQTSVGSGASAQVIIQLNFALPRYILMLDIWFSQMMLDKGSLHYDTLQKFLVVMLQNEWGKNHTDHHDTANTCLLCQATSLWFSLTTRIVQYYIEEEGEGDEGTEGGTPPLPKRGRISIKFAIPTIKRRGTQSDLGSGPSMAGSAQDDCEESWESASFDEHKKESLLSKSIGDADPDEEQSTPIKRLSRGLSRDRRPPIMGHLSDLELMSSMASATPSVAKEQPEHLSQLYTIFQLSVEKLSGSYHHDTILQIINLIYTLVTKGCVLSGSENNAVILRDSYGLLDKLWRLMEGDVSYVNQACVGLFLATQDSLISLESPSIMTVQSSHLWKLLYEGFYSQKWKIPFKTVDKLSIILHFMPGPEGPPLIAWRPHVHTELILAQGFCMMVRLVHDKETKVSTRVRYCLDNMKRESFEAIRNFMLTLFSRMSSQRALVLQTLSILSTTVTSFSFLSIPFFIQLLTAASLLRQKDADEAFSHPYGTSTFNQQKKFSDVSVLSGTGRGLKEARPSTTSSAFSITLEDDDILLTDVQCDTVSLFLEFIGSQNTDFNDTSSPLTSRVRRITRATLVEEVPTSDSVVSTLERLISKRFLTSPQVLCQSRIFETFIVKVYKILDKNVEFCKRKNFLRFLVCLLGYSVTPTRGDYPFINPQTDSKRQRCTYTLGYLPNHLQTPWLRVLFILLYKYSHLLVDIEINGLLLYCIETVVNTLSSTAHACPSHGSSQPLDVKPPNTSTQSVPESPHSPVTEDNKPRLPVLERKPLDPVPEESGSFSISLTTPSNKHPAPQHSTSVASISSTFTSSVSTDHITPTEPNPALCQSCNKPKDIYTEEVISLSVLCLGTCSHRIPSLVSEHLVTWLIPSISKVVVPGHYYWQTSSVTDPPPGSGMSIARRFLLTILTQFTDRRVFVYLFRRAYKDKVVFNAMVSSLSMAAREEDDEADSLCLTIASPIEYFLEDVTNSVNFGQEVTAQSLVNLADYLELVSETSYARLFWNLSNLEMFLKKIKEQHTVLCDSFNAILRVIIQLLKYCDPEYLHASPSSSITLTAILQEFPDIISEGLKHVYLPAGGVVTLVSVWYKAFIQYQSKKRDVAKKYVLLKHLVEVFGEGLSHSSSILPDNLISLCQSFFILLNEYVYLGYIDSLWDNRVYTPLLREQDFSMANLVHPNSTEGIEVAFNNALRYAVNYLACESSHTSLEVACEVKLAIAQLIVLRVNRSNYPQDFVRRIVEGQYSFAWASSSVGAKPSRSAKNLARDVQPGDHISSLMLLGWLLLGNLRQNSVHAAVMRARLDKMDGVLSNECEILLRLASPISEAVKQILSLVIHALNYLAERIDMAYWGLNCILCFCSIWTVYMELHVDEALPEICNFWRMVVDMILDLPAKQGMLLCKPDIVESFCQQAIIPIKKASSGVSCFSLLLPTWKRVINMLSDHAELPDYMTVPEVGMDAWFREMLKNFTKLESQYKN